MEIRSGIGNVSADDHYGDGYLEGFLGCFPSLDSVKNSFTATLNFCKRCIT